MNGSVVTGRPAKKAGQQAAKPSIRIKVKVPTIIASAIRRLAQKNGQSVSSLCRDALQELIDNHLLAVQSFTLNGRTEAFGYVRGDRCQTLVSLRGDELRPITVREALNWWADMSQIAERFDVDDTWDDWARARFLRECAVFLPKEL